MSTRQIWYKHHPLNGDPWISQHWPRTTWNPIQNRWRLLVHGILQRQVAGEALCLFRLTKIQGDKDRLDQSNGIYRKTWSTRIVFILVSECWKHSIWGFDEIGLDWENVTLCIDQWGGCVAMVVLDLWNLTRWTYFGDYLSVWNCFGFWNGVCIFTLNWIHITTFWIGINWIYMF